MGGGGGVFVYTVCINICLYKYVCIVLVCFCFKEEEKRGGESEYVDLFSFFIMTVIIAMSSFLTSVFTWRHC